MFLVFLRNYAAAFINLFLEMAPYLLLGFLFAGILHAFVRGERLARHLGKPNPASSIKAAVLGVPLPLCSCGVIPTGISLRKHGASQGATVSFLISTPQTGMDSILATSALMGWPMAIVRPIAAFVTGVLGGILTDRLTSKQSKPIFVPSSNCSGDACGCSGAKSSPEASLPLPSVPHTLTSKLFSVFHYGFIEMLGGIARWLLIGLALAALISLVVPDEFFARYLSNYWLSVLLVLAVSIPLYVCATGSIPIAMALIMKGMSPGVAFVFLMAGPATMASTIAVVGKALGRRTLAVYLFSIITGAVFFGYAIDHWLPLAWFLPPVGHAAHHHEQLLPIWLSYASALVLAILMSYHFIESWRTSRPTLPTQPSEVPMQATIYQIDTITCNNCKRHLEKDVGALAGVVRVSADVAASTLTVEGDVDPTIVRATVQAAGYQVRSEKIRN